MIVKINITRQMYKKAFDDCRAGMNLYTKDCLVNQAVSALVKPEFPVETGYTFVSINYESIILPEAACKMIRIFDGRHETNNRFLLWIYRNLFPIMGEFEIDIPDQYLK